jgi:hypothetical protein
MPRGLRQTALSISFLSPIASAPEALLVTNMASFIFRPERRFLAFTSLQSRTRPSFLPPGNIHSRSRLRRTSRTLPRFTATSFDDFAITARTRLDQRDQAASRSVPDADGEGPQRRVSGRQNSQGCSRLKPAAGVGDSGPKPTSSLTVELS